MTAIFTVQSNIQSEFSNFHLDSLDIYYLVVISGYDWKTGTKSTQNKRHLGLLFQNDLQKEHGVQKQWAVFLRLSCSCTCLQMSLKCKSRQSWNFISHATFKNVSEYVRSDTASELPWSSNVQACEFKLWSYNVYWMPDSTFPNYVDMDNLYNFLRPVPHLLSGIERMGATHWIVMANRWAYM